MSEIKKVKYDGEAVEVHIDKGNESIVIRSKEKPAIEFTHALDMLKFQIGRICGMPLKYIHDIEVRGVTFADDKVSITGLKPLPCCASPLVINTPLTEPDDRLTEDLKLLETATALYLLGRREQGTFDFFVGDEALIVRYTPPAENPEPNDEPEADHDDDPDHADVEIEAELVEV